ncbi:hypothetical protein DPMN_084589 [Dreissena polymorpha]|uniref:Uncharacterized protein n=1 Tax=Dreissena polymorpha TaxID=45954 RepID=A0A9D4BJE1_DREPO|nr:hypothetical protein DPMN_084589 [Dreissena polymorpha]
MTQIQSKQGSPGPKISVANFLAKWNFVYPNFRNCSQSFSKAFAGVKVGYFENPELKAAGQGAAGPLVGPGDKGAGGPRKLLDSTH